MYLTVFMITESLCKCVIGYNNYNSCYKISEDKWAKELNEQVTWTRRVN